LRFYFKNIGFVSQPGNGKGQGEEPRRTERSVSLKKKRILAVLAAFAAAIMALGSSVASTGATETAPNQVGTALVLDCASGKVRFNGLASNLGPVAEIDVTMTTDFGAVGPLHISAVGQAVMPTLVTTEPSVPAGSATFTWDNGGESVVAYSAKDCTPPAPVTKDISAKALSDHECDSSEWHFVIVQISEEALAPDSIHVTWANGAEADVPLGSFTGGVAHYATTSNLGSTVISATAKIYTEWSGQFNLSHGPCPAPPPTPRTVPPAPPAETPAQTPPPVHVPSGPRFTG